MTEFRFFGAHKLAQYLACSFDLETPMNTTIPDFTDAEQKLVSATLFERYGKLVPFQLADSCSLMQLPKS